MAKEPKNREGYFPIRVAWVTTRDGRRIYARQYGKKCFVIWVKAKR